MDENCEKCIFSNKGRCDLYDIDLPLSGKCYNW